MTRGDGTHADGGSEATRRSGWRGRRAAGGWAHWRRGGAVRRVVATGVLACLLGASALGGTWLWVQRSADGLVHTAQSAESAPVGLVLGAGLTETNEPSPFLAARLDLAADLYRAGKVKVLLVSGDNRTREHNEPDAMRKYLVERQRIPYERVVTDYAGRDTYDSCVRAKEIFGVTRTLVISQGYHVPRAVAICKAIGLDSAGVGDWTAEQFSDVWRNGVLREVPANIKALADVLIAREPILGNIEPGVTDALRLAESAAPPQYHPTP